MTKKNPASAHPYQKLDIFDCIEKLFALAQAGTAAEPPISFIDSVALTSLSRILVYIDSAVSFKESDYRMPYMISEIRRFADSIAIRLFGSKDSRDRLNYFHPVGFNRSLDENAFDWIHANLEGIENDGCLPADIDSTFSALHALSTHAWKDRMPPSSIFANCLKNLEEARKPDSPHLFNTWFADSDKAKRPDCAEDDTEWESADIVAMSSVVAFFDAVDPSHMFRTKSHIFEKLMAFLRNPIESLWFSDFYHSLPVAIYMISRCVWSNEQRSELASFIMNTIMEKKETVSHRIRIENDTDLYFYAASLLRLAPPNLAKDTIAVLNEIPLREPDADPLYIHSMKDGKTRYAASRLISFLAMFETAIGTISFREYAEYAANGIGISASQAEPILSPYSSPEISIVDSIRTTLTEFEVLSDHTEIVERLLSGTDFTISLESCAAIISDQDWLEDAMLTHALGLCTYFLYDKIYDQELLPQSLPILFLTNTVFQAQLQKLIDGIEEHDIQIPAEIESILIDTDISYLLLTKSEGQMPLCMHARKSIGTSLVPMLAMLKAGASESEVMSIRTFFEHFNLARQISDDAKDESSDESAKNPKATTMRILHTQAEIECEIFRNILAAKSAIPSGHNLTPILQKHLNAFAIKVIRAKWELSIVRNF